MKSGDEVTLKHSGEYYKVLRSGRNNDGKGFAFDYTLAPKKSGPPAHSHDHEDEFFEVKAGVVRVWQGKESAVYSAGDIFSVPAGTPHTLRNEGDIPAQISISYSGAGFEDVLEGLHQIMQSGPKISDAFRMAIHTNDHIESSRLENPFLSVAVKVMSFLGKLLGYKSPII